MFDSTFGSSTKVAHEINWADSIMAELHLLSALLSALFSALSKALTATF